MDLRRWNLWGWCGGYRSCGRWGLLGGDWEEEVGVRMGGREVGTTDRLIVRAGY